MKTRPAWTAAALVLAALAFRLPAALRGFGRLKVFPGSHKHGGFAVCLFTPPIAAAGEAKP